MRDRYLYKPGTSLCHIKNQYRDLMDGTIVRATNILKGVESTLTPKNFSDFSSFNVLQ